ncbi:hypothetical protein CBY09_13195 [Acidovorax kalamii]|uniref:Knr4/Smi1-like domain-containing protein n=2 Tax=Acidovorax kalamii TaxID=2004485 RepID=A0A235ELJ2_9BURK|nr:hypothetical protein CBY09_13195 [Acidovorax kalamii]
MNTRAWCPILRRLRPPVEHQAGVGQQRTFHTAFNMNSSISPEVIAHLEQGSVPGPAPEALILSVEQQYRLTFPSDYRAFLLKYGAALMPGFEVFGLVASHTDGEAPTWSDIRSFLRKSPPCVPSGWVQISDDGMDHRFFLACAPRSDNSGVFVLGPAAQGTRVSPNFSAFVEAAASYGIEFLATIYLRKALD